MRNKSLLTDAKQTQQAIELIKLGARLQVLQSETDISYERLLKLYKEVAGKSPSKGQLPFSTDWFMTWQENIHSSLFVNLHEYLLKAAELDDVDTLIKAYNLYLEQIQSQGLDPILSVTRAWRLTKFFDNGMLALTPCSRCHGKFVTHPHEIARHFVCGLCEPPARAGKGARKGQLSLPPAAPATSKGPAGKKAAAPKPEDAQAEPVDEELVQELRELAQESFPPDAKPDPRADPGLAR